MSSNVNNKNKPFCHLPKKLWLLHSLLCEQLGYDNAIDLKMEICKVWGDNKNSSNSKKSKTSYMTNNNPLSSKPSYWFWEISPSFFFFPSFRKSSPLLITFQCKKARLIFTQKYFQPKEFSKKFNVRNFSQKKKKKRREKLQRMLTAGWCGKQKNLFAFIHSDNLSLLKFHASMIANAFTNWWEYFHLIFLPFLFGKFSFSFLEIFFH